MVDGRVCKCRGSERGCSQILRDTAERIYGIRRCGQGSAGGTVCTVEQYEESGKVILLSGFRHKKC